MDNLPLGPSVGEARRRGRPKGARSKRSLDLGRYIEAHYGGMTPGQQAAAICLVTPKELRAAKAARGLHPGLSDLMIAMVLKAEHLALAIGVTKAEAWAYLVKERDGLMAYVHQRQAPAAEPKDGGKTLPMILMAPDLGSSPGGAIGYHEDEENQALNGMLALEVSQPKSHGEGQPLDPQGETPA